MDTKRFTLDTTLTLIAAYLALFVGLIDANAINLALPAIREDLGGGMDEADGGVGRRIGPAAVEVRMFQRVRKDRRVPRR